MKARVGRLLVAGLVCVVASGCGLLGAPPSSQPSSPEPSPTLLPAPKPLSSPEPGAAASPAALAPGSPVSAAPTVPPTRVPPPNVNPAAPSGGGSGERARVVNTEGQGANMRAEPSPSAALVRTIREGTELELIGAEREGGGRRWRNVRDPASGATGWIVSELLDPIASAPPAAPAASPVGEPKPSGAPKPAGSPAPPPHRRRRRPKGPRSPRRASATPTGRTWPSSSRRSTRSGGRSRRRTSRSSGPAAGRTPSPSPPGDGTPRRRPSRSRRPPTRFGPRAPARRLAPCIGTRATPPTARRRRRTG